MIGCLYLLVLWCWCEYSVKGSLYLRASVSRFKGKNENLFVNICRVGGCCFAL
jgi:hypothetical protein